MAQVLDRTQTANLTAATLAGIGVTALAGFAVAISSWLDHTSELASVVYLVLGALTGVVFLTWLWRARLAAEARGDRQRLARGWTIGGWLLPGANLVLPLLVVEDIAGKTLAVRAWWGLVIASTLIKLVTGTAADDASAAAIRTENIGVTVAAVLVAAAGWLLAGTVRRVSQA
ncbi:DUF4328 domain-containing protein [Labedaea rhizosphaerae]|uniref:Uncharacterized protein DUF4328 n=1 Tax=Labedaea rhizosphaerae TaxID=598644 RepID=A0A4R6SQ39_LABRH|nr:DUF4328 domain-containing protein [Labedaea rhizosphaerae]TDQ05642.1 uncharacterized protein DUF4328 [Labedaea rhizosphaerae]